MNIKEEFTEESFLYALHSLFNSNDNEISKKANQFLVKFERSPASWDIAYQVLLENNLSDEIYFNSLQILKNKIKYDFGNFSENPNYIEKLLSFFESNIDRFKKSKHFILLNYCDCIGKAFLFTGDKFKYFLQKFVNKLSGQNDDMENYLSLLLIFNFIYEASEDNRIIIDLTSRDLFIENIKDISEDVFQFILLLINKINNIENNDIKNFICEQILDAIINYMGLNLTESILEKFNNEFLPIIDFIFQIKEEKIEKHSECICYLLQFPLQKENMSQLAKYLFDKIYQFKDIFYKSIDNIDDKQASFYIDIFTLLIQNNLNQILKQKRFDLFQIIVDLTKKCPTNSIYTISDCFAYVNEYLYNLNYSIEDIMNTFENIFIHYIQNLISLTKFDDDIFMKLNNKNKESLCLNEEEYITTCDFRNVVWDILEDFIKYYRYNIIFDKILYPEINKIIIKIKENQKNINNWSKLENLLYIFSCLVNDIDQKNKLDDNIVILFHTMLDIPKEYIQITKTNAEIISYCPSLFSLDKQLLIKAFKYLINGLENDSTSNICSNSCKKLLANNKEIMSELNSDLLSLYNNKLKDNLLLNQHYIYIVEGIIQILIFSKNESNNDYEKIKNNIIEIMKPWVLFLQEAKNLIEKNNSLSSEDNYNKFNNLVKILKYISKSIFDGINPEYIFIMNEIFSEIWPSIIFILNKMSKDIDIVENLVQLIKIYMRGLKENFFKYIPDYLNIIINGYKLYPISSYLYAFEILVVSFPKRKEKELNLIFNNYFNNLCQITFNSYIKNESDLINLVNLGDDFFGMLFRIVKTSPMIVLESQELQTIINLSLKYINTSQIDISKKIIYFFQIIISYENQFVFKEMKKEDNNSFEKYKKIIQQQINNFSNLLCKKILEMFVDFSAEQIFEDLISLLKDFIKYQKVLAMNGMSTYLDTFPNDILTNKEKKEFLNLIEDYMVKEKEFDNFIYNLVNRCISKSVRDRDNKKYFM